MGCGPSSQANAHETRTGDRAFGRTLGRDRPFPLLVNIDNSTVYLVRGFWKRTTQLPIEGPSEGAQLPVLKEFVTAGAGKYAAGPLVRIPIPLCPEGVKAWTTSDTGTVWERLMSHNLYHGGEQLVFVAWLGLWKGKLQKRMVVVTSLGRIFVIKKGLGSSIESHAHVCKIEQLTARSADGETDLAILLPEDCVYAFRGPIQCLQALAAVIYVLLEIANVGAPDPDKGAFAKFRQIPSDFFGKLPTPLTAQDGGLHDSYTIWHNFFSSEMQRTQCPMPQKVEEAARINYEEFRETAIESICKGLSELTLDVSQWDATAINAMGMALRFNTVFRALVNNRKGSEQDTAWAYSGLAPVLQENRTLMKLDLGIIDSTSGSGQSVPNTMYELGMALRRNSAVSLADINLSGLRMGEREARAWAEAFQKFQPKSLVSLKLDHCSIPRSGIGNILTALGKQAGSLRYLSLTGNSLSTAGTAALIDLLKKPGIRTLNLQRSQVEGDTLAEVLDELQALEKLKEVDLGDRQWQPVFGDIVHKAAGSLQKVKLQGFQEFPMETVLASVKGKDIQLDVSASRINPGHLNTGLPNGGLVMRKCGLLDAGVQMVINMLLETRNASAKAGEATFPKLLDISENVLLEWPQLYDTLAQEWQRPYFTKACIDSVLAGNMEEGFTWFERSMKHAVQSYPQAPDGETWHRLETAKQLARLMKVPELQTLKIAGSASQEKFGPFLVLPIALSLPADCALTSLDISGNQAGDVVGVALGQALRKNRTLTALRFDRNGIDLEGLKAFKGCLHGNKKLTEVPFPDHDMEARLSALAKEYQNSLQKELNARRDMQRGYYKGYVNQKIIRPAMAKLKEAKGEQSKAMRTKDQLRAVASDIQTFIFRNQKIAEVKNASKASKMEKKEAEKAAKAAAKARGKERKLKVKVWQIRHKLFARWVASVQKVNQKKTDTSWFSAWAREWGKAYMTKQGVVKLWEVVPENQKEMLQSTYDYSVDAFKDLDAVMSQLRELGAEADNAEVMNEYLLNEASYHDTIAAKDLVQISAQAKAKTGIFAPRPGIVATPDPGKVDPRHVGYRQGTTVYWQQRRRMLYSQLGSAIQAGPPEDFVWGHHVGVAVPSQSAVPNPTLVYGYPVQQPTMGQSTLQQAPREFVPFAGPPPATGSTSAPVQQEAPRQFVPFAGPPPALQNPPSHQPDTAAPSAPPLLSPNEVPYGTVIGYGGQGVSGYSMWNEYVKEHKKQAKKPAQFYNHKYTVQFNKLGEGSKDNTPSQSRWQLLEKKKKDKTASYHYTYYNYTPYYGYPYYGYPYYGYGDYSSSDFSFSDFSLSDLDASDLDDQGGLEVTEVQERDLDVDFDDAEALGEDPPEEFDTAQYEALLADEVAEADDELEVEVTEEAAEDAEEGGEAEEMDMYGGAGPRDLPDGGSDGKGCKEKSGKRWQDRTWAQPWKCKPKRKWSVRAWRGEKVCYWFERLWLKEMKSAEESVLGETKVLQYDIEAVMFKSTLSSEQDIVTLVTQMSVDRLDRLKSQATAWGGRLSVAVYLPAPRDHPDAQEATEKLQNLHSELESQKACSMDISVLFANHVVSELTRKCDNYDLLYPVNALRNLALEQARTELVFLLDVDFVPSPGLRDCVEGRRDGPTSRAVGNLRYNASWGIKEMLVVPAFELCGQAPLPTSKLQVMELIEEKKAHPFHVQHFPKGHSPTNFDQWKRACNVYSIEFEEYFEPYVIAARDCVPKYDERFRGYGMNKIAHLYTAACSGVQFKVLPENYVTACDHKWSSSREAVFGSKSCPLHRVRIAALYRRMKHELLCTPGTVKLGCRTGAMSKTRKVQKTCKRESIKKSVNVVLQG